ncbi:hypothetical protein HAX54_010125 [Datura stramonium]|uniref:Uncharacterized protein n=1 Tax=Datura stramonium TaxID=4076 RepID=A0ABS8WZW5_DATST|nr:hypothetical protein [Datura stramonium]
MQVPRCSTQVECMPQSEYLEENFLKLCTYAPSVKRKYGPVARMCNAGLAALVSGLWKKHVEHRGNLNLSTKVDKDAPDIKKKNLSSSLSACPTPKVSVSQASQSHPSMIQDAIKASVKPVVDKLRNLCSWVDTTEGDVAALWDKWTD